MSGSIEERKLALRSKLKDKLAALDPLECEINSQKLCAQLSALLAKQNPQILLAWLNHFPGEPNLESLITGEIALGRAVYLPRVGPDARLTFHQVSTGWSQEVSPGKFGVREPAVSTSEFTPTAEDRIVILVPGLAFDLDGNRLGRGKGYYDRALELFNRSCGVTSIGTCWELQIVTEVPRTPHDLPVSLLCTEERSLSATAI